MTIRRALQVAIVLWAAVGAALALAGFYNVNDDARVLVGLASVIGPLGAGAAAFVLGRHADRPAGALLLLSAAVTPTYMAYPSNALALVTSLALLAAPHALLRGAREARLHER